MDKYIELFIEEIQSKSKPEKGLESWEDINIMHDLPENVETTDEELERMDEKSEEDLVAHLDEVEKYLSGEGMQTLSEITQLFREQFPPKNKLTEIQKIAIIEAYLDMLYSYNITLDFPEKLPINMQYELVVDSLEEEVFVLEYGFTGIDYCTGNPEGCKLKQYCPCLHFSSEYENRKSDFDDDNDELPF
jgi:hypothetical protein